MQAVGPLIQAAGSIYGGIAGQQAADYQATVARNNALTARQNAQYSAEAGSVRTEQQGLKSASQLGSVKAAIAANGLDVNSGSAADVQVSQREIGTLNQATEADNAALQVYGYNTQKSGFLAQSKLDKSEGEQALIGGIFNAVGSLVGAQPYMPDKFSWMQGGDAGAAGDAGASGAASGASVLDDLAFAG